MYRIKSYYKINKISLSHLTFCLWDTFLLGEKNGTFNVIFQKPSLLSEKGRMLRGIPFRPFFFSSPYVPKSILPSPCYRDDILSPFFPSLHPLLLCFFIKLSTLTSKIDTVHLAKNIVGRKKKIFRFMEKKERKNNLLLFYVSCILKYWFLTIT